MGIRFHVQSMYGAKTKAPLVELMILAGDDETPTFQAIMMVHEAHDLANLLLHAAYAAEADAQLTNFALEDMEMSLQDAASLLYDFRAKRDAAATS